jgi:hypothetical protein
MIRKICILLVLAICILPSIGVACELPMRDIKIKEDVKEEKPMLTFDKEVVRKMLLEDGYKEKDVEIEENRFSKINAKLQPVLDAYLVNRTISPDFNVNGLTMKIIMEKYSCNFWNAIGFMDSYLDDPEGAKLLVEAPPIGYGIKPIL